MKSRFSIVLVVVLSAGVLLSCQLFTPLSGPAPVPTSALSLPTLATLEPTAVPVATTVVTASAVTVDSTPTVEIRTTHEEGETPKYTVDIEYPFLVSTQSPAFNDAVSAITKQVVQSFKDGASAYPTIDDPNLTGYNSVNMYTTILQKDTHTLSVFLQVSEYYRGMAHPGPSSRVVNYSFDTGKVLALADLFKPDADYLKLISDYCVNELKPKEDFVFPEGAEPKAENYANWNLTPDGLQITFPPYQVAPYAAGFIRVTVPYAVLQPALNPTGPLMYIIKQ